MKKLLILAYDFPPYVSVGGLRPYNWFKYLKESGIEPIVVTRQWDSKFGNELDYIAPSNYPNVVIERSHSGMVIRAPYEPNLSNRLLLKHGSSKHRILRKIVSGFYEVSQYLYPVGPKSELYVAARNYLKANKVDCIIATGDPFVLFAYADQLSNEFNIPWIADYRDPWSQSFSIKKSSVQKKLEGLFERKVVRSASIITTVDELFKLKLTELFPSKQIQILSNGFDPEAISTAQTIDQGSDVLTFSFVGTIYRWHPVRSLLNGFSNFAVHFPEKKFRIKFYGINDQERYRQLIQKEFANLTGSILFVPKIPNNELLKELSNDNVFLLFNYYQFTGTKIYDYLGLKRKILLCFTNDPSADKLKKEFYFKRVETDIFPQKEIIEKTHSGILVKDSQHLSEIIGDLFQEFSETGMIRCDSVGIENYSRKIQVEKLAEIVKEISR